MGEGKCAFFAHDFSHLYTTGTKREMRKNSIEFFHIPARFVLRTNLICAKKQRKNGGCYE